jgi:hypothetical protein
MAVNLGAFNEYEITTYVRPSVPFLEDTDSGPAKLFSMKWGCFIVDEIQKFTKISAQRSQGLASVCAFHHWGLSGTMFDEPTVERIFGYHLIINDPSFPRTLPGAKDHITHSSFKGVMATTVFRNRNEAFIHPKVNEVVINHDMYGEEEKIYLSMKESLIQLAKEADEFLENGDVENMRRFNSYVLAVLIYIRQSIVFPLLPISNIALNITDYKEKSQLSKILLRQVDKLGISDWLKDPRSVKSSRMTAALGVIESHPDERLVIFMCFRSCLDIFRRQLPKNRPNMTLESSMTTRRRAEVINDFANSTNGILVLTYELGAEGLNLQMAHTVLILDLWWNNGKTQQAIARVLRYGQKSPVVNVYYFTSNTGIENAMFDKHADKIAIAKEIKYGPMTSSVSPICVDNIIMLLNKTDNVDKLNRLREAAR